MIPPLGPSWLNASVRLSNLPDTEPIEQRVVHSAEHGKAVGAEEGKVVKPPAVKRVVKVLQHIQHIDWEPAGGETCR